MISDRSLEQSAIFFAEHQGYNWEKLPESAIFFASKDRFRRQAAEGKAHLKAIMDNGDRAFRRSRELAKDIR